MELHAPSLSARLRAAPRHSGDTTSTGSICSSIGAAFRTRIRDSDDLVKKLLRPTRQEKEVHRSALELGRVRAEVAPAVSKSSTAFGWTLKRPTTFTGADRPR